MRIIIIKWWMIKLLKTMSLCATYMEINHWNEHCFTPVFKLRLTFRHFQSGCHPGVATCFYQKWYRKLNILTKLPWLFAIFWAFDRNDNSKIDGAVAVQKFDLFCNLMTSSMISSILFYIAIITISWYIYTLSLIRDFCSFFSYHEKCFLFHLQKNIEGLFKVNFWRHQLRHHYEILSYGLIWDDLFIPDVKLKLCLTFWHFQNGRHFGVATKFLFTKSDTGCWICQQDSHLRLSGS